MSDVRLDGDTVVVEGAVLRAEAPDLVLDHRERRRAGSDSGRRRALVHDPNDGLTLNWNGDYPGGVTLFGPVRAVGGKALHCKTLDLELDHPDRRGAANADRPRRALVHDGDDGLTLNWDGDYPGGVTINGPVTVSGPLVLRGTLRIRHRARTAELPDVIGELESAIEALTQRVAALESP